MVSQGIDARFFREHLSDIAGDLGLDEPTTRDEEEALLSAMVDQVRGGELRGEALKMSRWYSWMRNYKRFREQWHTRLAVLKHWHVCMQGKELDEEAAEPPPEMMAAASAETIREEIWKLRKSGVHALSCAVRFMTPVSRIAGAIITKVVEPLWHYGSRRAHEKKSATDNLTWTLREAIGWQDLLSDLVRNALCSAKSLNYMSISDTASGGEIAHQNQLCTWVFEFLVHLLSAQAWTYAKSYRMPPTSFILLLSQNPTAREAAVKAALADWQMVLHGELRATRSPSWREFMGDLHTVRMPIVRITWMLLERHQGVVGDVHSWLQDLFVRKGDSRIIENLFRGIRQGCGELAASGYPARATLHACAIKSDVLECAMQDRIVKVEATDLDEAPQPDPHNRVSNKGNYVAKRSQLPTSCGRILLPPNAEKWRNPAITKEPEVLMAWEWWKHWESRCKDEGIGILASWPSALLPSVSLIRQCSTDSHFFCLSSTKYGAIGWDICSKPSAFGEETFFSLQTNGQPVKPHFVIDPGDFEVQPYRVVSLAECRVLNETGLDSGGIRLLAASLPQSLLRHSLSACAVSLTKKQIEQLLGLVGIVGVKGTKHELLKELLFHVFDDLHETAINEMLAQWKQPETTSDKLLKAMLSNPAMAAGMELLKQMDPDCADDYKEVNALVEKHIFGSKSWDGEATKDDGDHSDEDQQEGGGTDPPLEGGTATPVASAPAAALGIVPEAAESAGAELADSCTEDSSGSGSSSDEHSEEDEDEEGGRGAIHAEQQYRTPDVLKEYVPALQQALWQDLRQNRFQGYDKRCCPEGTEVSLTSKHFSRSYGGRRSHRDALLLVVEWLQKREQAVTNAPPRAILIPLADDPRMGEVFGAPVAKGYYPKR
jgi:hypothetical protein